MCEGGREGELVLDGDGDVQELVCGDEAGHVMADGGQGEDAGGGPEETQRALRWSIWTR